MPLIEARSLSKSFGNQLILKNINFRLEVGEITTLIGQNGAGKTTLAKIILGQEKYDQGELIVQNNIKIGYVPQQLNLAVNIPINAKQLLKILAPNYKNEALADWHKFLQYEQIKGRDIASLSGGQRQKLFLIGTILHQPDLLILDEPSQYLDVASQKEFYQLLNWLKKERGISIFVISHDLFTVMKNSDQVICLNGHICCSGKPADLGVDDLEINKDFKQALSEIGVYIHQHNHRH